MQKKNPKTTKINKKSIPNTNKKKINPRKIIIKSPIIQKSSKQITKRIPQTTKILVETKQNKNNWLIKIIKLFIKSILFLLPIVLIGGALWLIITRFFPEVSAQIIGVADKIWNFTKNNCHKIDDITQKGLQNLGIDFQYSSIIAKALWIIGGLLLAGSFFYIPFIGITIGRVVLVATITYAGVVFLTNNSTTTQPNNTSPPQQIESQIYKTNPNEENNPTENPDDTYPTTTQKKKLINQLN
jgi:epidermal growth factor receptor substrate 15